MTAGIGHNGGPVTTDAAKRLKSFVERITKLNEEKAGLQADIREVFSEAKGSGFDVKTLRRAVRESAKEAAKRQEEEALWEVYRDALGL